MTAGETSDKASYVSGDPGFTGQGTNVKKTPTTANLETDPNCNPQRRSISSVNLCAFFAISSLLSKILKSKATTENSPSNPKMVVSFG